MPDIEHLELDGKLYDIADRVARDSLNEMNDKIEDIKNSSGNGLSTELKTRYDTATLQSMYNEVIEPSPEEWFKVEIDNDNNTATWVGMNSKKYQDFATVKQLVIPYQFQGAILKTIGNGTECMGWDIPELTAVKLPNCVTEISQKAFKDAAENLENINIPLSCTKIGYEAFSTCSKLKTVEVSDLNQNFTIGERCFDQCVLTNINPLLEKIETLPAKSFSFHLTQNIIIPENIVQIEREALTNTHEEWFRYSVTILNPNCEIHKHAFTNNKLTLIKGYKGSTAETFANTYNIPFVSIEGTEVFDKADKADTLEGYGITDAYTKTKIDGLYSNLREMIISADSLAIKNAGNIKTLQEDKADKTIIKPDDEAENITFDFSDMYNSEKRLHTVSAVSIKFVDDEYAPDYISGLSFDSGETPTGFDYTDSGIINWVGTDCVKEGDISIFQPSPNTHYDIVFYFNGVQFIGLVNGFVPATGNVVSE